MIDYKKLDSTPPPGAKPVASVATMEVTVDVQKQELLLLRSFSAMVSKVPVTLKPEAQIVLQAMFDCFGNKHSVQEGQVKDLGWGFSQCGIPPQCTAVGLKELEVQGYIKFQAPDNTFISSQSDQIDEAFVRYQKKLLDMVYDR